MWQAGGHKNAPAKEAANGGATNTVQGSTCTAILWSSISGTMRGLRWAEKAHKERPL